MRITFRFKYNRGEAGISQSPPLLYPPPDWLGILILQFDLDWQ